MTAKIYLKKRTTHYVEHLCSTILLNLISLFYSLGKKQFFFDCWNKNWTMQYQICIFNKEFQKYKQKFQFYGAIRKV
jgi:hypothetical protein